MSTTPTIADRAPADNAPAVPRGWVALPLPPTEDGRLITEYVNAAHIRRITPGWDGKHCAVVYEDGARLTVALTAAAVLALISEASA